MITRYNYYKSQGIIGIAIVVMAITIGVSVTEYSTKTIIIIVLTMFGVGISVYKPNIPLFLFFLLLPMQSVTVLPSQSLSKFIGLYLVGLFVAQAALTKRISLPLSSKSLWILVFGFLAILSSWLSEDISMSLRYLPTLIFLIIMYFLLFSIIRSSKTLNWAVLCLIIGGALSAMLNLMLGIGKRGISLDYTTGGLRSAGLAGDPNEFAAIILVLMPLSLLMFFRSKGSFKKALSLGLFAVLLIGFLNTFSRGGFLAFSVMLMLSMFKLNIMKKRSNKVKIFAYVMLIAIIGVAVFYPLSQKYVERVETLQSVGSGVEDSSLQLRLEYVKTAFNVFWEYPILGVGLRNFKSVNPLDAAAHNMYLEVLTGMGLIGFISFMTILYLTWRELKRVQKFWKIRGQENSLIYQLAIALELGFLAYLVAALFLSLDISRMTWLLITLSSVLWGISLNEKEAGSYYEKRDTHPFRRTALGRG